MQFRSTAAVVSSPCCCCPRCLASRRCCLSCLRARGLALAVSRRRLAINGAAAAHTALPHPLHTHVLTQLLSTCRPGSVDRTMPWRGRTEPDHLVPLLGLFFPVAMADVAASLNSADTGHLMSIHYASGSTYESSSRLTQPHLDSCHDELQFWSRSPLGL